MAAAPPTLPPPAPPPPPRYRGGVLWAVLGGLLAGVTLAWMLAGPGRIENGAGGSVKEAGQRAATRPPIAEAVRETDTWRLGADGMIEATSRVTFSVWPEGAEAVLLILPYPEARIVRVRQDGAELRWQMRALLAIEAWLRPLPPGAKRGPVVVEWELPLGVLARDERGYRARLRALLPVVSYRLDLALDPDGPWAFRGDPRAAEKTLFSQEDTGGMPRLKFGSCGLGLTQRVRPVAAQ